MVRALLDHALRQVVDEDSGLAHFDFTLIPGKLKDSVTGTLTIDGSGEIDGKMMKKISDSLQTILGKLADQAGLASFYNALDAAKDEAEDAAKKLDKLRTQAMKHRHDLLRKAIDPENLDNQINSLESKRFTLQVELAGLQASHETLMQHIGNIGKELKKPKYQAGKSIKALERSVLSSSKELDAVRQKARISTVAQDVVSSAERRFLEAELKLLNRRQAIAKEHSAAERSCDLLKSLNERAVDVEIERKSIEARLGIIEKRMQQLQHPQTLLTVENYRQSTRLVKETHRRYGDAAHKLSKLRSQKSRMQFPRVKIISLYETPKKKK